jgi:hypothetical protein
LSGHFLSPLLDDSDVYEYLFTIPPFIGVNILVTQLDLYPHESRVG